MTALSLPNPLSLPRHTAGLVVIGIGTCAINLLSLAFPIATLQVYDRVLYSQNASTLQLLVAGVLIALLFETVLRIIRSYIICYRGAAYTHGVGCAAMNAQLDGSLIASRNKALANDLAAFNSIKSLKEFGSGQSLVIGIDLMFLPIFIAVMASISQTLVLVPVGLLCIFAVVTAVSGLGVRQTIDEATDFDNRRYDFLVECLSSAGFLKSHAAEKLVQRRFEGLHRDSCQTHYTLSRSVTQSFTHGMVLSHLMTIATVAAGAYLVSANALSIGALIAVVQLSSRLMQPVQKAVLFWLKYQEYQAARFRALTLFEAPASAPQSDLVDVQNDGNVELEGLSYRASPDQPLLFSDINLVVGRGETVVLDGANGSGKSTLLKVISGIYPPTSGTVRINGVDIARLSESQRSRMIAYISPHATMFRGSIRDNITRFGDIPLSSAMEVAKLLGLSDEFSRLPRGIDTQIGPGNEFSLTPGLTQMIAILRALACKPRVILYDDADIGLDHFYYNKLYSVMGKLGSRTAMIVVSRDLNIRELGSRHVTLIDGRLATADVRPLRQIRPEARI